MNKSIEERKKHIEELNKQLEREMAELEAQEKGVPVEEIEEANAAKANRARRLLRSKGKNYVPKQTTLDEDLEEDKKNRKYYKKTGVSRLVKKSEKILEEHNVQIKPIKMTYRGQEIVQYKFINSEFKAPYTRDEIQKIANNFSKKLSDKGFQGAMLNNLYYNDLGYRGGGVNEIGEDVYFYVPHDSDLEFYQDQKVFREFNLYVCIKKQEGGKDEKNDCLYNSLKLSMGSKLKILPSTFKQRLGLTRLDEVSIKLMPQVEEIFKNRFSIYVSGDFQYISPLNTNNKIYLKLVNGHYTVDSLKTRKCIVFYNERKPLVIDRKSRETFDGKNHKVLSPDDKITLYNQKEYVLVEHDLYYNPSQPKLTLEQVFERFVQDANYLKKETKGIINLYKTGTMKQCAFDLFDRFSKTTITPEPIGQIEAQWINDSGIGALIDFETYTGCGYDHDIKSQYPSIMISPYAKTPIQAGEFKLLTSDEIEKPYILFGIYRCEIEESEDPKINKLFRFNPLNKYPHISIKHAHELGLKVNYIQDGKPNCLIYSGDKLKTNKQLFEDFVNYLYPLKEQGKPLIKKILNCLWGGLSESFKYDIKCDTNSNEIMEIYDTRELMSIIPDEKDSSILYIRLTKTNNCFKSNFARIKPFITAEARFRMGKMLKPFKDEIVKIHTDGFISKTKLDIKLGDKIGDLEYKGFCDNVVIINNGKPKCEFKI